MGKGLEAIHTIKYTYSINREHRKKSIKSPVGTRGMQMKSIMQYYFTHFISKIYKSRDILTGANKGMEKPASDMLTRSLFSTCLLSSSYMPGIILVKTQCF